MLYYCRSIPFRRNITVPNTSAPFHIFDCEFRWTLYSHGSDLNVISTSPSFSAIANSSGCSPLYWPHLIVRGLAKCLPSLQHRLLCIELCQIQLTATALSLTIESSREETSFELPSIWLSLLSSTLKPLYMNTKRYGPCLRLSAQKKATHLAISANSGCWRQRFKRKTCSTPSIWSKIWSEILYDNWEGHISLPR